MSIKGQGHSLTLVQITNHSDSIFLIVLSSVMLILTYPQHSGKQYRTSGPLVLNILALDMLEKKKMSKNAYQMANSVDLSVRKLGNITVCVTCIPDKVFPDLNPFWIFPSYTRECKTTLWMISGLHR